MAQVNHLETIEVAAQSAGKSTAADDSDNQISQAIADRDTILISTTSPVTVAASVYNRAYEFKLTNDASPPVADFTVQFAARVSLHRGQIKVVNNTSFTATLEVASQASPKPTLEMGQTGYYDLFATEILEGPGSGGVGSAGDWKDSVRLATTANITLSGEQTIDGFLTSADRVLVKDQSTASENGLYLSAAGAWSRATDADTDGKVTSGLSVHVAEGTANADNNYQLTTNDPIVLGTTALTFTQYGSGGTVAFNDLTDVVVASPATGDLVMHDGTDWDNKSINDLTEDTTPDKAADYIMTWDASGSDAKKVTIGNALGSNVEVSVKRTADLTGQDHTTAAAIAFNDENYDTDTWHDNSTNPSRLTVPSGATKVDLNAYIKVTNITADEWVLIQFYKNGTAIDGLQQRVETGGTERNVSLTALGVECVATDYFEVFLQVEADTTVDIDADSTFVARVSISGGTPADTLLGSETFSAVTATAAIDISGIASTSGLRIEIMDGSVTGGPGNIQMEVSTDGGSTWKQGASDYAYAAFRLSSGLLADTEDLTVSAMFLMIPTAGTATNMGTTSGARVTARTGNPADDQFIVHSQAVFKANNGSANIHETAAWYAGAGTVDAIRLVNGNSTNMSGRWAVYEEKMA